MKVVRVNSRSQIVHMAYGVKRAQALSRLSLACRHAVSINSVTPHALTIAPHVQKPSACAYA